MVLTPEQLEQKRQEAKERAREGIERAKEEQRQRLEKEEKRVVVPDKPPVGSGGFGFRGRGKPEKQAEIIKAGAVPAPPGGITQAEIARRVEARQKVEQARRERILIEPTIPQRRIQDITSSERLKLALSQKDILLQERLKRAERFPTLTQVSPEVSREIRVRALTKEIQQTKPVVAEGPRIPVKKKPTATIKVQPIVVRPSRPKTPFEEITGRRLPPEAEAAILFPEGKLETFAVATGLLAVSPKTITQIGLAFEFTQPEIAAPLITIGTALEIPSGLIKTTVTRGPLAATEQVVFGTAKFFISPQESLRARTPIGISAELVGITLGSKIIKEGVKAPIRGIRKFGEFRFERRIRLKPEQVTKQFILEEAKIGDIDIKGTDIQIGKQKFKIERPPTQKTLLDLLQREVPPGTLEVTRVIPKTKPLITEFGRPIRPRTGTQLRFRFPEKELPTIEETIAKIPEGDIRRVTLSKFLKSKRGGLRIQTQFLERKIGEFGIAAENLLEGITTPIFKPIFLVPSIGLEIETEKEKILPVVSKVQIPATKEEIISKKIQERIIEQRKKVAEEIIKKAKPISEIISIPIEPITEQIPKTGQIIIPIVQPISKVQPIQRLRPIIPTPTKTIPTITPTIPLKLLEEEELKPKKIKGFDSLVKVKGKFKKLNRNPLLRNTALNLALREADNTPAVTVKVKPSGFTKQKFDESIDKSLLAKFERRKDIEGKGFVHVEKNKFRIDSIGELINVQRKGARAPRKKGSKQFGGFF